MSALLRVTLIVFSIIMLLYVGRKIRIAKMRLEAGIIWLAASVVFIIISIWPNLVYRLCNVFGIMSPTNLVYLIVIAFLMLLVFYNAIKISSLESRIDHLAQEMALRDERFVGLETRDRRLAHSDKTGTKHDQQEHQHHV